MKKIEHGVIARTSAIKALNEIAEVVAATVGPAGRPILLSRNISATNSTVFHTKDGITVLRELSYVDPVFDAVHKIAMQAAADTLVNAGDGTSSLLILASAFATAFNNLAPGNPQELIRTFRKQVQRAVDAIEKEVVMGLEAEQRVALTSTNGDTELANTVLKALDGVSAFGVVLAEKNPMSSEKYSISKEYGYQAGGGYGYDISFGISVSDVAVTNGDFYMERPYVVPYNGNLVQLAQILPIINGFTHKINAKESVNLLIVAYEISDDIRSHLIVLNRQNPLIKVFVTKTNPTAEINGAWNQLNDVAAFSGASITDAGLAPQWTINEAGRVDRVRVTPYKTFISGRNALNWIIKRAEQNEKSAQLAQTPLDREIIQSRNGSLTGGLVKLTIGAGLPGDLEEIAARADDAIRATQACRRSGALPGCGVSYIRAGHLAEVEQTVQDALKSVHLKIMENYGHQSVSQTECGETLAIRGDKIHSGNFIELGVADSFETIKSVILNGFALGSFVANLGGFCVNADIEEIQKGRLLKELMMG